MDNTSKSYFKTLNYTLTNEDSEIEWSILPENTDYVLTIAGSGSRVIPLLAKNPKNICCVDLSKEQLLLTEFRIEALRMLDYEEYLKLLGYLSTSQNERKGLFNKLDIRIELKNFMIQIYTNNHWRGIIYTGKWEKSFIKISKLGFILKKSKLLNLFLCNTLEEQQLFINTSFPQKRWKLILFIVGNAKMFNYLLYKGFFPKININFSYFEFYQKNFERLFKNSLAKDNFFLQFLFFGKILFPNAYCFEVQPQIFHTAKLSLNNCQITYQEGCIIEIAQKSNTPIDFISFSNTPSYFSEIKQKTYLQSIRKSLAIKSKIILRYYLKIPKNTDKSGYNNITDNYTSLISQEKTQMYTIEVLEYKDSHKKSNI